MLWVVQSNLYNEHGYQRLMDALVRLNVDHVVVKPVPFSNMLVKEDFDSMTEDLATAEEPIIDGNQPIMVCGATTLSRVAQHRGWSPGTFLNDNFDFATWRDGYGPENCLNGYATVCEIKDAEGEVFEAFVENMDEIFVRPVDDGKAFAGTLMRKDDFREWQQSISKIEQEDEFLILHKNTKILFSEPKKIYAEYRFFVVDGRVVTGSLYKLGNQVTTNEQVDERAEWMAACMASKEHGRFQPADAYVLDIAETPDGFKIVEINNLNSAGFYACDVAKIVNAIEDMTHKYE